MSGNIGIEELLEELGQEGRVLSKGRFTLSPEKLREKLAAFQFERPSQWILKIVQGLVAAEATAITVKLSRRRTKINFAVNDGIWTSLEWREAFLDPESECTNALRHITTALWFVAFNLKLAWLSTLANSQSASVWTGTELNEVPVHSQRYSTLEIFHPDIGSQQSKIEELAGANWAAEISRELSLYAYTCPVPLELDGLRMDNLILCPCISQPRTVAKVKLVPVKETVHVASIGWGQIGLQSKPTVFGDQEDVLAWEEVYQLTIPPATPKSLSDKFGTTSFSPQPHGPVDWMALVTARIQKIWEGDRSYLGPCPKPSLMSWVYDGVIVKQIELPTNSGVSCHLFVSGEAHKLDLSGLKLSLGAEDSATTLNILGEVGHWLERQSIRFDRRKSHNHLIGNLLVGAVSVGITAMTLSGHGTESLGMLYYGLPVAAVIRMKNDDSASLHSLFGAEHEILCREWRNRVCSPSVVAQ